MAFKKYFTLSFDDGVEQDKTVIALMKKYSLGGTFNLNAGLFGQSFPNGKISRIPKDEIAQVYDGFEIASHGYGHENFGKLSIEETEESIARDIRELAEITGYPIKGHAYPYGVPSDAADKCLRSFGITYTRTVGGETSFRCPENFYRYVPFCWFNAENVFSLIDKFLQMQPEKEDLIFMMWGHGYELEHGDNICPPDKMESIFSKISGRDDIIYCSNREVFGSARSAKRL